MKEAEDAATGTDRTRPGGVRGEHLLLAAVTVGQPASEVLSAHGVTPELVEEEIVRRVGLGAGAGLFGSPEASPRSHGMPCRGSLPITQMSA